MTLARTLFLRSNGPVTEFEEALDCFLTYNTAIGTAPYTRRGYAQMIRQFFTLCPPAWNSPLQARTAFLSWLGEDIAPATYNLRLIYVRAFWRWCVEERFQPPEPDPFRGLKRRKDRGHFRDIDAAKVKELLTLPDRSTWAGLRDYALILFTLDTAARPGERFNFCRSISTSFPSRLRFRTRRPGPARKESSRSRRLPRQPCASCSERGRRNGGATRRFSAMKAGKD